MFTSSATANQMQAATAAVAVRTVNTVERSNWRGEANSMSAGIWSVGVCGENICGENINHTSFVFATRFMDTNSALSWGECVR